MAVKVAEVCLSTTEAEYIAATEAGKEMIWLKRLLQELGLNQMEYIVYCDSQSAIDLSKNSMYHARTKHINVRYYWICEQVESELLRVKNIDTSENPADVLTKITKRKVRVMQRTCGYELSLKKLKIPFSSKWDWMWRCVESIPFFGQL